MNLSQLQSIRAQALTRRWFLRDCGVGLGAIAAGSLLAADSTNPLAPRQPHYPAKAKRVIYIFQAGAPSHLELFDNKPELTKRDDEMATLRAQLQAQGAALADMQAKAAVNVARKG